MAKRRVEAVEDEVLGVDEAVDGAVDAAVPEKKVDAVIEKVPENNSSGPMSTVKFLRDIENEFICGKRYSYKKGQLGKIPLGVANILKADNAAV